jgi:hypothetical protein
VSEWWGNTDPGKGKPLSEEELMRFLNGPSLPVLDEDTCRRYRKAAGRAMQHAIYRIDCPQEAREMFGYAMAWRAEFDA